MVWLLLIIIIVVCCCLLLLFVVVVVVCCCCSLFVVLFTVVVVKEAQRYSSFQLSHSYLILFTIFFYPPFSLLPSLSSPSFFSLLPFSSPSLFSFPSFFFHLFFLVFFLPLPISFILSLSPPPLSLSPSLPLSLYLSLLSYPSTPLGIPRRRSRKSTGVIPLTFVGLSCLFILSFLFSSIFLPPLPISFILSLPPSLSLSLPLPPLLPEHSFARSSKKKPQKHGGHSPYFCWSFPFFLVFFYLSPPFTDFFHSFSLPLSLPLPLSLSPSPPSLT